MNPSFIDDIRLETESGTTALACHFGPLATSLRFRAGQKVPLVVSGAGAAYFVTSGVITIHAAGVRERSIIYSILYPGDLLLAEMMPPGCQTAAIAAGGSACLRIRSRIFDDALSADGNIGLHVSRQLCRQQARLMLRIGSLGLLTSEEKIAAFLVEAGLRLGTRVAGGVAFDLPLSRNDVAAYLALNPDTLSRQMSCLKQKGIVEQLSRSRFVIRDWEALRRECQLANELEYLHKQDGARS